jgi:lipid A ethanolaminephosphotransferase
VIGEALRADHLSLNGYHRLTNPRLSKRKSIFSFPAIYSEFTNTNMSLPHILTVPTVFIPSGLFRKNPYQPI